MGIQAFYDKHIGYRTKKAKAKAKVKMTARLAQISTELSDQSAAIKSLRIRKDRITCMTPTFEHDDTTKSIVKVIKAEIGERNELVKKLESEQTHLNDRLTEISVQRDTSANQALAYS